MNGENRAYRGKPVKNAKNYNAAAGILFLLLLFVHFVSIFPAFGMVPGMIYLILSGIAELWFAVLLLRGKKTGAFIYPSALYILVNAGAFLCTAWLLIANYGRFASGKLYPPEYTELILYMLSASAALAASVLLLLIILRALRPSESGGKILKLWRLPAIIRGCAGSLFAALICFVRIRAGREIIFPENAFADFEYLEARLECLLMEISLYFNLPVLVMVLSFFALWLLCRWLLSGSESEGQLLKPQPHARPRPQAPRYDPAPAPQPYSAPAPAVDIPSEIRRWKKLQEDGIITAEEFEEKKKELLKISPIK